MKALKEVLRARGVTYAKLAKSLALSEASVKRVFANGSFTLARLDQVCDALGMEITDLAKMVRHDAEGGDRLSREQEQELVSDAKLLLVAVHALNNWTLKEIVEVYELSQAQCIRLLARLDRLGIIELLPDNRVRPRVGRNFAWLPDGPIQQYFRSQVQNDYFRSRFDGEGEVMMFVSGMLSKGSNAALQSRMRRLSGEFSELHNQDLSAPRSERWGTSLLVALRPWSPPSFVQMRRAVRSKG
ncbi:MAG TPA: helix-turn-helix transcriptional regulator [Burkholderiales bacterium]|nr:helix-turn-helix transcriptional regulator [Burkholderiales bacterium]